jgi:hypothetical protein
MIFKDLVLSSSLCFSLLSPESSPGTSISGRRTTSIPSKESLFDSITTLLSRLLSSLVLDDSKERGFGSRTGGDSLEEHGIVVLVLVWILK